MILRVSKTLMVFAIALFASLVAFDNITDYSTNFDFVRHVLLMDTTFPGNGIMYRAITSLALHHVAYVGIITLETATAALCWVGGIRLWCARRGSHMTFQRAKGFAIAGLTLGFLTWEVAFMSVGGEWFGMWMSKQWNGMPDAFRFFITILSVLIFLSHSDDALEILDRPDDL
ncbi:hypothetical protein AWV80_22000 [Cupriavidus sp. UYMU48A]|nr:hypothetical protein AWV80_22000 [Cupriavidus sp. UYMU48A]